MIPRRGLVAVNLAREKKLIVPSEITTATNFLHLIGYNHINHHAGIWSGRSTPSHRSIQGRTEPELEMHLNPSMGAPKPNRSTLLQRAQHITCSNQANKGPEGVVIDPHLTSGLPVMFRYSCIPQMPTATPVAANSGYTCTAERPPISKPREREREREWLSPPVEPSGWPSESEVVRTGRRRLRRMGK
jgi:hypothetical protein